MSPPFSLEKSSNWRLSSHAGGYKFPKVLTISLKALILSLTTNTVSCVTVTASLCLFVYFLMWYGFTLAQTKSSERQPAAVPLSDSGIQSVLDTAITV